MRNTNGPRLPSVLAGGKRHRAQQGSINVLSGSPYGYRYVKKTDTSAAYYEVVESEAEVVRLIFDAYTRQGLSLGAIAGLLNQREVPTRTRQSRWERPTLWRMLHNPAYAGHAFYGKTELRPRRESHAVCVSVACAAATVRFANGLVRSGSKSLYPLWSAKQPSLWRKSNSRRTRGFPSTYYRTVLVAGTVGVSALRLRTLPYFDANFPAHDLLLSLLRTGWLPASEGCGLRQQGRFVRSSSMRSCGRRLCGCWKIPACCRRS